MEASESARMRTYGNWRKPMSAGLGKLGMIGTGVLLLGIIVVVVVLMFFGPLIALAVAMAIGAFLGTLIVRDRHSRTVLQRLSARVAWRRTRGRGEHLYRSGPLGQIPSGTFQLPGLAAPSTLSEGRDSYDRPFALVHVPATGHFTVVFATEPDGASLVDQAQVDSWVAQWGHWLNSLGDEPGVVAAQVVVETAPDTGARLQREVLGHIDVNAPELAQAMLHEVVATYPVGSATVKAWIAVTFRATARAGGKRRSAEEMSRDLGTRLPGLGQRLHATGAGAARPMTAQQLCEVVRIAYEPRAARIIDDAYAAGVVPELSWGEVGPTATQASWDSYRHDGATSVSWSMTSAPRGEVPSSVLAKLLEPHRDIPRKRVSLLYQTMDSARAANTVEADKHSADFRATSSTRPAARILREQSAAHRTAKEEAEGAGLVNFGMIVTATALSDEQLPDVTTAIENLAGTARIKLRPVFGSQDSAFAAALPLGLVLSAHLRVPAEIRAAL